MLKMKLRYIGDPVLATKALPVQAITTETMETAKNMLDIMHRAHGIGLAGNQVGLLQRIVVIDISELEDEEGNAIPAETDGEKMLLPLMPIIVINPEIIHFSDEKCPYDEGCLSVPGIYANVNRSSKIILKAEIAGHGSFMGECGGLLARVLQHEIDHLDGHIFVERVTEEDLESVRNQLDKVLKKYAPKNFKIRKIS